VHEQTHQEHYNNYINKVWEDELKILKSLSLELYLNFTPMPAKYVIIYFGLNRVINLLNYYVTSNYES
jgi:hypothetical protein